MIIFPETTADERTIKEKAAFRQRLLFLHGNAYDRSMTQHDTDQSARLNALRAKMSALKLDGYLIPRADEYMGEYVPECAERLSWLTGFTGSAGLAVVLKDKALVLSDGRYDLQLKQQVDAASFETMVAPPGRSWEWIIANAGANARIGYDPRLHTGDAIKALGAELDKAGLTLEAVEGNLIDAIWANRPAPPASTVEAFAEAVAGRSAADKREDVRLAVQKDGGKAVILNAPDSIAWLLNIRGGDVPHNPFALSTAIVRDDGSVDWFIDKDRIPATVASGLGNHVQILAPAYLSKTLDGFPGQVVLMDDATTPIWFRQRLEKAGATVKHQPDPCTLPKACKTSEEQTAIKAAHVRDGVAIVRFLKWIDEHAPKGKLSEQDVVNRLLMFRKQAPSFRDTSFDTIAGWAGNGAIVHYRVTPETNLTITPPGILLVDSGAQYPDGTTDITRTIAVGEPSQEMKDNNTRVLKGHIGIAMLKFPKGTVGKDIDVLARQALWNHKLDYAHGTGHGVGCYLSVHERGVGISSRANDEFRPGMLVSNEPGYYKTGEYGIRIENLILVTEDGMVDGRQWMAFETVTLAPIDKRLIEAKLLNAEEAAWLDAYHERVHATLSQHLDAAEQAWLKQACAPLQVSPKSGLSPVAP
jgi:Xaa-Pro aminopeptidase